MRKVIAFLIILSLWFLGSIFFPFNQGFYSSINIPNITPNNNIISLIWIIIYILNTTSLYFLIKDYDLNDDFNFILILNYLFCELFPMFFFYLNSLLFSLISVIVVVVTSYFLFIETKKINKTLAYLFLPYLVWSFCSLILSISIFLIN